MFIVQAGVQCKSREANQAGRYVGNRETVKSWKPLSIIRAFPITDHIFTYYDQNNLLQYHDKHLRFLVNLEKLIKYKEEAQR